MEVYLMTHNQHLLANQEIPTSESRSAKMRIGVASLEYNRTQGIERSSAEIADRLAAWGHEVHFHCAASSDTGSTRVRFHRVATLDIVNSTRISSFAAWGSRDVRKAGYQLTHSHGLAIGCDVITAHSCHRAGMDIRRQVQPKRLQSRNLGVADRIRLFIEYQNFGRRRYKKIIAVAEGVRRELSAYYAVPHDDVVVIPNGVDLNEFALDESGTFRRAVCGELRFEDKDTIIMFVGNEFDRKGLEYIIEALHILHDPTVRLLVAGNDDISPYLRKADALGVKQQVVYLGRCREISRYYKACDLFCLPTSYEAFSLATLEAAACGLPLLVTKVNGTEELVTDGENGYFISRDGERIAEAIRSLLHDHGRMKRMGLNAHRSAQSYGWDEIARRVLAVYERVLDR